MGELGATMFQSTHRTDRVGPMIAHSALVDRDVAHDEAFGGVSKTMSARSARSEPGAVRLVADLYEQSRTVRGRLDTWRRRIGKGQRCPVNSDGKVVDVELVVVVERSAAGLGAGDARPIGRPTARPITTSELAR